MNLIGILSLLISVLTYLLFYHHVRKNKLLLKYLSQDMHDDIGSALNAIHIYAILEEKNQECNYAVLIKQTAKSAIARVRDIIWILDDKSDDVSSLSNRVSYYCKPLCEANNIVFNLEVSQSASIVNLTATEKRNLLLMVREIITNAVRHAGCTFIRLVMHSDQNSFSVLLEDNGKGFPKQLQGSGYGLSNIIYRARRIGYHATLESGTTGTKISLQKPLQNRFLIRILSNLRQKA